MENRRTEGRRWNKRKGESRFTGYLEKPRRRTYIEVFREGKIDKEYDDPKRKS